MSKREQFRSQLNGERLVIIVGAHNALAGRLVQDIGFDGLWIGSFEIAAAHGFPDANILSMTEMLATAAGGCDLS